MDAQNSMGFETRGYYDKPKTYQNLVKIVLVEKALSGWKNTWMDGNEISNLSLLYTK